MPPPPPRGDITRAVKVLYDAGWSTAVIALLAGRTRRWVYSCLHREGVRLRGRWGTR